MSISREPKWVSFLRPEIMSRRWSGEPQISGSTHPVIIQASQYRAGQQFLSRCHFSRQVKVSAKTVYHVVSRPPMHMLAVIFVCTVESCSWWSYFFLVLFFFLIDRLFVLWQGYIFFVDFLLIMWVWNPCQYKLHMYCVLCVVCSVL